MLRRLQPGCENAGTVCLRWRLGCRRWGWASRLRAQGSRRKWLSKQNYALIHVGTWQRNVRPLNLGFKFVISLGFVTCAWILILMYIGDLISLLNLSMHKKKNTYFPKYWNPPCGHRTPDTGDSSIEMSSSILDILVPYDHFSSLFLNIDDLGRLICGTLVGKI